MIDNDEKSPKDMKQTKTGRIVYIIILFVAIFLILSFAGDKFNNGSGDIHWGVSQSRIRSIMDENHNSCHLDVPGLLEYESYMYAAFYVIDFKFRNNRLTSIIATYNSLDTIPSGYKTYYSYLRLELLKDYGPIISQSKDSLSEKTVFYDVSDKITLEYNNKKEISIIYTKRQNMPFHI